MRKIARSKPFSSEFAGARVRNSEVSLRGVKSKA
jgi:hypothetical protein